jgi:tetratricopeptide (TPR) repeat protein
MAAVWAAVLAAGCSSTPDPDRLIEAYQDEADAKFEAGLFTEAAALYEQVAQERPLRKHAHVRAALCHQRTGRAMAAVALLEHVRDRIDRKDLFVLHALAELYLCSGFLPEASEAFKAILAINPYDLQAKMGLREAVDQMSRRLARPVVYVPPPPAEPPPPAPEPPPPGPILDPPTSADLVAEGDRMVVEASAHARHLAAEGLPSDRVSLLALRVVGNDASTLLAGAVHKYREAQRVLPTELVQGKIDMAVQVRAFVERVLREIDERLER